MVFEGILIQRVPYKERDLIVKLLLRNGLVGSFYVYGGQGGGKKQKPTNFEIGSMLRLQIKEKKAADLMVVNEHSKIWSPGNIRYNVQAFYLTCLYFEILQKFALPFNADELSTTEHEGVFAVTSNALFYMDEALGKESFIPEQHLSLFMIKLLFHLGIMPDTDNCSYCQTGLLDLGNVSFLPDNGHFACPQCVAAENEKGLLLRIKKGFQTKYQDYHHLFGATFGECDKLIQFFCHHFHLRPVELKSYALLFK